MAVDSGRSVPGRSGKIVAFHFEASIMHIHILGICGTFMGGLAVLAKEAGHTVTGCDANVYPPMSSQLEAQGITLIQGFGPEQINLQPDLFRKPRRVCFLFAHHCEEDAVPLRL